MKKNYFKPLICSVMTCSMLLSCFGNLNIYATSDYKNEEILNSNYLNKTEDLDSTLKNQEVESNTSERPLYGFENIDGNWYYYDVTTGELQTGFITVPIEGVNRTFYANANGILQVGLIEIDSNKYYFDPEKGYLVTGFVKLDPEYSNGLDQSSYFDENGHMVFGEQIINGTKYIFDDNGAMITGNFVSTYGETGENKISYLDSEGNPVFGQQFIDGNWYYFDENGQAITGFKDLTAEENFGTPQTVYYDVNGQMVHGEKQIDGAIYYFDPDTGALTTGFQSIEAAYSLSGTDKMSFYEDSGQLFVGERMFQDIYFKTDANGNIISTQLNGVPYFNQRDPQWINTIIGGYRFGSSGCVPTTATMIINFFKGTGYNPLDIGNLLYQRGYFNGSGMGTSSDCWSFISSNYGLGYRNNLGYEGIIQALKDGMMVAGAVGYGTWCPWWGVTHEVLMFGIDEAGYTTVYDPYELSRCGRYHVSEVFNQRSTDPFDNLNGGPFFALGYDQYFGVSKNDFNGSFDVKVKIGDGNSHTVTTRIWTDQNGQDDLKEYTNNLESDYYIAKIDIKDHNNEYGKYYIETYVDGRLYRSKNIIMNDSSQETTVENVGNTDTNFKITTSVTNVPGELVEIQHA
ncbi:GBS Bsp-like repeat-containing protein, partial [Faecalitalea cylindroides]|uniref:GBS Bsp-like repeat-containing protein n=1 Tax=Faecalitalea cylindroides TaxID=39483 RepID=UPI00195A5FEF